MVEGSQPDWRGHGNEPLDRLTEEMLDLDAAVGVALEFQTREPETLILVTADHETGGLGLEVAQDSLELVAASERLEQAAQDLNATLGLLVGATRDSAREQAIRMGITAQQIRALSRITAGSESLVADYTTLNHTAEMVPLFAKGPQAELFAGIIDNHVIGRHLLDLVRR